MVRHASARAAKTSPKFNHVCHNAKLHSIADPTCLLSIFIKNHWGGVAQTNKFRSEPTRFDNSAASVRFKLNFRRVLGNFSRIFGSRKISENNLPEEKKNALIVCELFSFDRRKHRIDFSLFRSNRQNSPLDP